MLITSPVLTPYRYSTVPLPPDLLLGLPLVFGHCCFALRRKCFRAALTVILVTTISVGLYVAGVKVGEELTMVQGMLISHLDMIFIENILKISSSVDVTVRSTTQQPSRPVSQHSVQSAQLNHVVGVAVTSSAETASHNVATAAAATAGNKYRLIISLIIDRNI